MTHEIYGDEFTFTNDELRSLLRRCISIFVEQEGVYEFSSCNAPQLAVDIVMGQLIDNIIPFDGSPVPQPDSVGGVADLGLEPAF